jgi:hypothetical protein
MTWPLVTLLGYWMLCYFVWMREEWHDDPANFKQLWRYMIMPARPFIGVAKGVVALLRVMGRITVWLAISVHKARKQAV